MLGRKAKRAVKEAEDRLQNERIHWSRRLEESNKKHQQNKKALDQLFEVTELIFGSIVETFGQDGEIFLPKPNGTKASIIPVDGGWKLVRKETDGKEES